MGFDVKAEAEQVEEPIAVETEPVVLETEIASELEAPVAEKMEAVVEEEIKEAPLECECSCSATTEEK